MGILNTNQARRDILPNRAKTCTITFNNIYSVLNYLKFKYTNLNYYCKYIISLGRAARVFYEEFL